MDHSLPDNLTREEHLAPGSARNFGLVMGGFFAIGGALAWWHDSANWWQLWLPIAVVFVLLGVVWPRLLNPLNNVWFRFGLLLHKVISPLLMGLIFFGAMLPVGMLMRLTGRRPLQPHFDRSASTYWQIRSTETQPGTMSKQY